MSYYEGWLYGTVISRLQRGLNAYIARMAEPGSRVLEAGCGSGNLTLPLSERAGEVVAVELSSAMIEYARRRQAGGRMANTRFVHGDITTALRDEGDGTFDLALIVLVIHEMPHAVREATLHELTRLCRKTVVVDFERPQPRNFAGLRNRSFERLAGSEHFAAFQDYNRRGGLPEIARRAGLQVERLRSIDSGSLGVWEVAKSGLG